MILKTNLLFWIVNTSKCHVFKKRRKKICLKDHVAKLLRLHHVGHSYYITDGTFHLSSDKVQMKNVSFRSALYIKSQKTDFLFIFP